MTDKQHERPSLFNVEKRLRAAEAGQKTIQAKIAKQQRIIAAMTLCIFVIAVYLLILYATLAA